jgi:hypothetical protein
MSNSDVQKAEGAEKVKARATTIGITPRALILGTVLIPLMCYWVEYTEIVAQGTDLAAMSLIIGAVFALFLLICLNGLLSFIAPKQKFSQAEMLFVYIMQTVSIGICGIGMMQFLVPTLGNGYYYANGANSWKDNFHRYIPLHLVPKEEVLPKFYQGNASLNMTYLMGWLSPILWWSAFIFVLLGAMLCLNVILRRQWVDNEKLAFPIVYLPLELTRNDPETGPLFRNPLFWAAFLIPCVLETLCSLNYLYPGIPAIPLKPSTLVNLSDEFNTPPWSAMKGSLTLGFYPLVIGLTYFLPADVSFSAWFFYLFSKFEDVAATATGLRADGVSPAMARIPYHGEQGAGAFLGLALIGFWSYRKYLSAVFGKFLREPEPKDLHLDDTEEAIPYRLAFAGFWIGFGLLVAFGVYAGMVWWLPVVFLTLYFCFAVTFTRVRAEAGLPWGFGPWMMPHGVVGEVIGSRSLDAASLTSMGYFKWMDNDMRCLAMPHQLEALKMGASNTLTARMNPRHMFWVILWATLVACFASWWALLSIYYQYGAATGNVNGWRTGMGSDGINWLDNLLRNPTRFEPTRLWAIIGGAAFTGFLMTLRTRFLWWPLHPVGYVIAETQTMGWLWCPTLVGWAIKVLVLRYGGIKLFRRLIPFFIGLILGDYIISCLWTLLGLYLDIPTYRAFPI